MRVLDGDDAPDFLKKGKSFKTRFADVPTKDPAAKFIERLAELEITAGCSSKPARYCPDDTITRGQLATFISRALDLPKAEPIGFWDVDEDSYLFDHVNRLVASGINDGVNHGCTRVRFVPFNFCPGQLVSRGEVATTLSEVIDYLKAREIIKITQGSQSADSIGLQISFKEERSQSEVKITWTNPKDQRGGVSHYVLQWRPSWDGFNYRRYRVIEFDKKGRYKVELPRSRSSRIYAIRVVIVYNNQNKDRPATNEVKVNNGSHKLRDAIKEHVIDAHGEDQPWLVDTWRHLNGPNLAIQPPHNSRNQVSYTGRVGFDRLRQTLAVSLTLSANVASNFMESRSLMGTVIHELAHVYTNTNGLTPIVHEGAVVAVAGSRKSPSDVG